MYASPTAMCQRDNRVSTLTMRRAANGTRTFSFPASSENPVSRGDVGEILSHAAGAIRLDRANRGAMPILFNHNWDQPIGMVSSAAVKNKRLNIDGGLFATARAQEIGSMIDGGLKNVSIGYQVHATSDVRAGTYTATDWEPYEVSIVTVPADPSVGVGRALAGESNVMQKAVAPREPAPTVIAMGSMPKPGTREHAALHESGHAVALVRTGITFSHVESGEAKDMVHGIEVPKDSRGLEYLVLATLAGGASANEDDGGYRGLKLVAAGADGDFRKASEWIDQLCRDHDFARREPLIAYGLTPLAYFEERVAAFVNRNQVAIYRVANELLARKRLTAEEVAELIA